MTSRRTFHSPWLRNKDNYIAHVDKHAADLCDEIRRQSRLEVRVIKPRGFIIAGTRSQLHDEIIEDNFSSSTTRSRTSQLFFLTSYSTT